jgi:YggT family protein
MHALEWLLLTLISLYKWVFIIMIVMSWLFQFNIVNYSNPTVKQIYKALLGLTEPVSRPIRRMLPDLGGMDISPIFVFIGLQFLEILIQEYWPKLFY